jgi:hypothetical protein
VQVGQCVEDAGLPIEGLDIDDGGDDAPRATLAARRVRRRAISKTGVCLDGPSSGYLLVGRERRRSAPRSATPQVPRHEREFRR